MEQADLALGWLTGLRLLAPYALDLPTLLATAFVANVCNALFCRFVARSNGYPSVLWTVLGFVFGVWAVTILICLPRRIAPAR